MNADFSEELNHWQYNSSSSGKIIVKSNQLTLKTNDAEESVLVSQKILTGAGGKKFRFNASVSSKNIVAGEEEWYKARLLLVQYINGAAQWRLPHSLALLEGNHDWQRLSEVFSACPECSEVHVMVQMSHCSGEFSVKELSLYEVEETDSYTWIKWSIKAAWLVFVFVLFISGLKRGGSTLLQTFIILTVSGIVIGTILPGDMKNELKESITDEARSYTAPVISTPEELVDPAPGPDRTEELAETTQPKLKITLEITKVAHFCLFALLAFFLLLNSPGRPVQLTLLELFMLACATELMQFYVDDRIPLLSDVFIDMAGGGTGILAGRLLSKSGKFDNINA